MRLKDQEFISCWNEVIIFTSKDVNLTKSHVKYLESRLTFITKDADRYNLENANTPTQSSLPRADVAAMEEYIENYRLLLGTARSGPQSWKDDMGRSMKEVEESLLVCN